MTDEPEPPATRAGVNRVWFLVAAIAVVLGTGGIAVVITWIAVAGSQETEARLDTEDAAVALTGLIANGPLVECPAGRTVLAELGEALGGGPFTDLVSGGEPTVSLDGATVECTVGDGTERLSLVLSPRPADALAELGVDESWARLGASRGGRYVGDCGEDACRIVWSDDHLLAGLTGHGAAFRGVERERVQVALAVALPPIVDRVRAAP